MTAKIEGIFTPNIVPLHASGEINEPELRRYIDWLIDRGVHGLYPNVNRLWRSARYRNVRQPHRSFFH